MTGPWTRAGRRLSAACLLLLSACGLARCTPEPIGPDRAAALYANPLPPPEGPVAVYFIGHSLVGRDMPAMLAQLAGAGFRYESQIGWGAELEAHWEPGIALDGGEVENDHPRFREAHAAVASGDYDALVLTEKVEIRDSIRYHDSWRYLSLWARKAWEANPRTRVYLYETWHRTDDPEGWLDRLDRDLARYWEGEILDRALAAEGIARPIHVIPAGQVMARFVREAEARGGVDGIRGAADLFADDIHFNDLGAYLVALTQYAVLLGKSPVGLPHALRRADGTPAEAPGPAAARLMQEVVWDVVTGYPRTGVGR